VVCLDYRKGDFYSLFEALYISKTSS